MDMVKMGSFLAELRKEQKLTQAELGEKLGVTNKTALINQNVEIYLCGTIGSLLAIIYYCVLNNRMLAYVEDHIYGGKWNEYKSDSDNR